MASDTTNTKKPSNSLNPANAAAVQLHPELLMAAKRGDWSRLEDLMNKEGALVPEVLVDIDMEDDEPPAKWTHTYGPDSILHVVASGGDGEAFLMSAGVIYGKAKHLLGTCNAKGDTPLHCAARSGSIRMVSHLIDLARRDDDDGAARVQVALRKQNKQGETALHEAVRWADEEMVGVLMSADAELARFPRTNGEDGASPLYLAILLGHDHIAELLYEKDNQLSCSGPDGQNALHVAVLRSKRMTKKLLAWNKNLIKQGDRSSGRTPLHFAASRGSDTMARLLLEADESSAYQSDNNGSFPIHMAALGKNLAVVHVLLEKCLDCAQLRDAQGRTFVHIAVHKKCSLWSICSVLLPRNHDACQVRRFASIMNMQDDEGNTALHLAAMDARRRTIHPLVWNKEVELNLQNKKGQTALDLSVSNRPRGVSFALDPKFSTQMLLKSAGARFGVHRGGEKKHTTPLNVKEEAKKIKDSATTIGVVSVLILTVSFAAAFQLPGGYNSTGDKSAGTPVLTKKYSFQAFLVANTLAVFCSSMATLCLMYAGLTIFDIQTRMTAFARSIVFLNSSARSLVAAFAFGTYAVLAPVAHASAVLTWLLTGFVLLDIAWIAYILAKDEWVLLNRHGIMACWRFAGSIMGFPLMVLWPYVVIAGFIAYTKVHGIH
ncbi:uncharacterized protein LOC133886479 [Phragmites australis]|uniref:uncharacterized protein LOC133886479 n=1 Tax=Phragmites australis TaxID=29695 RepID=UPI002D778CF7|nr:uncharacterized protein LOC133886479 [Phragmites australis]